MNDAPSLDWKAALNTRLDDAARSLTDIVEFLNSSIVSDVDSLPDGVPKTEILRIMGQLKSDTAQYQITVNNLRVDVNREIKLAAKSGGINLASVGLELDSKIGETVQNIASVCGVNVQMIETYLRSIVECKKS